MIRLEIPGRPPLELAHVVLDVNGTLTDRASLAEFDRKRDYRYAAEPNGQEQESWTQAIRHYVGREPWQPRDG